MIYDFTSSQSVGRHRLHECAVSAISVGDLTPNVAQLLIRIDLILLESVGNIPWFQAHPFEYTTSFEVSHCTFVIVP